MALAFQPAAPKTLNPKHAHILEAPRDFKRRYWESSTAHSDDRPPASQNEGGSWYWRGTRCSSWALVSATLCRTAWISGFIYSLRVTVFVSSDGGAAVSRFGLKAATETWLWVYILFNYFPACHFHFFFLFWFVFYIRFLYFPACHFHSFSFFFPLLVCFYIFVLSLFIIPCSFFFQQRFKEQHFSSVDEVKAAVRNCFRKQDGKSYRWQRLETARNEGWSKRDRRINYVEG